jgi:hypothetical protein
MFCLLGSVVLTFSGEFRPRNNSQRPARVINYLSRTFKVGRGKNFKFSLVPPPLYIQLEILF